MNVDDQLLAIAEALIAYSSVIHQPILNSECWVLLKRVKSRDVMTYIHAMTSPNDTYEKV